MRRSKQRPPLDDSALADLALSYVGRFATTRAKLRTYLQRKLRERGWSGSAEPDLDEVAERLARQGFIDDRGYAVAKAQALSSRGYGPQRLAAALKAAGVGEEDSGEAKRHAREQAATAALRFAQRRRLGPFSERLLDGREREKVLATMIRAGHGYAIARMLLALSPGANVSAADLAEQLGWENE